MLKFAEICSMLKQKLAAHVSPFLFLSLRNFPDTLCFLDVVEVIFLEIPMSSTFFTFSCLSHWEEIILTQYLLKEMYPRVLILFWSVANEEYWLINNQILFYLKYLKKFQKIVKNDKWFVSSTTQSYSVTETDSLKMTVLLYYFIWILLIIYIQWVRVV